MARKSPKCPPTVEPNQLGCVWNFSGMFDHHHNRPHRKMLSNESHKSKSVQGAGHAKSQVQMLTFDEQLRILHIKSKKKTANVNQSPKDETSSSNHTKKKNEVWKNTIDKPFWKKIISRSQNPNKKKENTKSKDRIVVLKPNQRVVESPVDVGCRCSYLHLNKTSTNKKQVIKHTHASFNDLRKKLRNGKNMKKAYEASKISETNENDLKREKLMRIPFVKNREPDLFVEARRHLAERFRQVENGPSGSSSKRASRTLERILLSSPVHQSMATISRVTGRVDPNNILDVGILGRSRSEYSVNISSPKAEQKSETDQFRENPSPVSVLDSFFTDNISSPTSTIESVELQIQPNRLDFEEHSSQTSSPPRKMEDRGFISSYCNEIYQIAESNWVDFLSTDYYYPLESSCDHKLLHDCVKEVLVGLHSRVTFFSSKIRPFSLEKDVVNEVVDQVDWHNGQPMVPRTLDVLVRRDIAKCGNWVDVISDRNDIVFEVVDDILMDLIIEGISDIQILKPC